MYKIDLNKGEVDLLKYALDFTMRVMSQSEVGSTESGKATIKAMDKLYQKTSSQISKK